MYKGQRDATPALQHADKKRWLIFESRCLRRSGMQIHAGPFSANEIQMSTPRLAGRVAKLSKRALVHSFGQLLLRELLSARRLKLVAIIDTLVESVEGHTLGGKAERGAPR